MWWQFKSAFARKIGYLLAALFFAFVMGQHAFADANTCTLWQVSQDSSNGYQSYQAACSDLQGWEMTNHPGTYSGGAVNDPTQGCALAYEGSPNIQYVNGVSAYQGSCPQQCTAQPGVYDISPPGNTVAVEGSAACGSNNCNYVMGPASTARSVIARTPSGVLVEQSATTDGSGCNALADGPSSAPPLVGGQMDSSTPVDDCTALGGTTTCVTENSSGTYCGTYNGDYVCLGSQANNTCVTFKSGGAACTVANSTAVAPGAPDNGTVGQSATPAEQVTGPSGQTVDYYSPAQVAASKKPVSSTGVGITGSVTGITGSGATGGVGGGSGTGSSSTACPAGQTCSGAADSFTDGGNCTTPPACLDTEPVLCGIANEEWLFRCESASSSDILNAIGTVTGPQNTTQDMSATLSESGTASVDAVTLAGDTTCPAPITINFMGKSIDLDIFAQACKFFAQMAFFVMTAAYMVAARVMFTGAVSNSF